jgi:hypothetical protein
MKPTTIIVIHESGADLDREPVTREPEPPRQLEAVPFAGTGTARGEYEERVEYIGPLFRGAA